MPPVAKHDNLYTLSPIKFCFEIMAFWIEVHSKITKMSTNGNDKAGKCPAVVRVEVGGGGGGGEAGRSCN